MLFRILFLILMATIFIYQMNQSFNKFFRFPVVKEVSMTSLDEIPQPTIYICKVDLFDYDVARSHGYPYLTSFMAGFLSNFSQNVSTTLSWRGANDDLTFEMLSKAVFRHNYSDVQLMQENTTNFEKELTFVPSHGFCLKLQKLNLKRKLYIYSKDDIKVLILDGLQVNQIQLKENLMSYVESHAYPNNAYSMTYYDVKFIIHDEKMFDGITCTDYEQIGNTYGECFKTAFEKQMIELFGCIPSWMPFESPQYCPGDKVTEVISKKKLCELMMVIDNLMTNQEIETDKVSYRLAEN